MKYCKKCKRTYSDNAGKCENCGKPLFELDDDNTPVYLLSASGFERERIMTALVSNGIPCDSRINKDDVPSAEIITGVDNAIEDILVPASAYEKAYEICVGIGAVKLDGETTIVEEQRSEEFEEMPPKKRTAVKILSAILFIIIVALVIFGTDAITGFIKGLFN